MRVKTADMPAYKREYARARNKRFRDAVLAILGNKCSWCGLADLRVLQIDHVNGGGNKERLHKGPYRLHRTDQATYYQKVINEVDSGQYQLLCANCNWIKRVENKEER